MLLKEYKDTLKKLLKEAPQDKKSNKYNKSGISTTFAEPEDKLDIKFKNPENLGNLSKAAPKDIGKTLSKNEIGKKLSTMNQGPAGAVDVYSKMMNKVKGLTDINTDNDLETPAKTTAGTTEPKDVTPENLPDLIRQNLTAKGVDPKRVVDVNWMQLSHLPGYMLEQLRAAFRPLFKNLTDAPLEKILVATDLGGLSGTVDIKQLIGYITHFGTKDDSFKLEAFDIDPKLYHISKAFVYYWDGINYLILEEKLMGMTHYYIYSGPGRNLKKLN